LNVLFVTSEAFPLIKTGGLADVSGSLPKALLDSATFSGSVRLLIPGYNDVLSKLQSPQRIASVEVFGQHCDLVAGLMPDSALEVIAVRCPALFERIGGPYNDVTGIDWPDNPLRFGTFSRIASLLCSRYSPIPDWRPDIIHCNDWQSGLALAYLKLVDHASVKSLFSIHNLAFQGNFDPAWVSRLGLPLDHFNINGFEFYQQLSFLKAGIFYADQISTVSPTYAQEIQTEAFGFGLQGLLKTRSAELTGILNGIDTHEWNPTTDQYLPTHYSAKQISGKKDVKRALQARLALDHEEHAPLLGVVSRLTHQKGLDLLAEIIPQLVVEGCQFAVLGSGDRTIEARFNTMSRQYPGRVSVNIGYHEALSHNIMAGADMFIMPSRFEPCGLNQLYGLTYGTPPIVSDTGGLADSVCHTTELTLKDKTATGFVVKNVSAPALLVTIQQALQYWADEKTWQKIQLNGMKKDVSWASQAIAYLNLYQKTLEK
jgi:starch synthase